MHAVKMVRSACVELNMATFEWSIADGLRALRFEYSDRRTTVSASPGRSRTLKPDAARRRPELC